MRRTPGEAAPRGRPLSSFAEGERARLAGIEAGPGLRARLAAMGLVPGVQVLMVRNSGYGPAVVEVKGTRLALGRGMTLHMRAE